MNDDLRVMTTINFLFISYPICSLSRLLDKIRTNPFNASYFVYCAFMTILMFEQLNAMCGHVSVFPRVFWPLVFHFSLLFPFLCIFFLFSFRSRVLFFFQAPFLCPAFPSKSFVLLLLFWFLHGRLFYC